MQLSLAIAFSEVTKNKYVAQYSNLWRMIVYLKISDQKKIVSRISRFSIPYVEQ